MVKSIQSMPWIVKDAPSRRVNISQQKRSGIASIRRTLRYYRALWPRKCLQYGWNWFFFQLFSRYSLLMPNEDISTTRSKKKAKDRVSLIICANASRMHKIPSALIGKPKEPTCIKDWQWPIPYFNQTKAWMDVKTCYKWFNEVFYRKVKKRTKHRILLLMDNASGHFETFERDNIQIVFLSPKLYKLETTLWYGNNCSFEKTIQISVSQGRPWLLRTWWWSEKSKERSRAKIAPRSYRSSLQKSSALAQCKLCERRLGFYFPNLYKKCFHQGITNEFRAKIGGR